MTSRSILVTGATGFVGLALVARLREAFPEARLRALARSSSAAGALPGGVEVVLGDLRSAESLARALEGVDAVVHAAALTRSADSRALEQTNVAGSRNLAAACLEAGVNRFVLVGSSSVYGAPTPGPPRSEDAPLRPTTAYARSKLAAEWVIAETLGPSKSLAILRPSAIYGPGAPALGALLRSLARRRTWITSPGDEIVRPTHVDDLATCVVSSLADAEVGIRVLNVAGERALRREEYRDRVAELAGIPRRRFALPSALAAPAAYVATRLGSRLPAEAAAIRAKARGQLVTSALDTRRVEERYGLSWKPLEAALREAVASFRATGAAGDPSLRG